MGDYDTIFDTNIYEESPEDHIVPWQYFTRDLESNDLPVDNIVKTFIDVNRGKQIDLRPYLILNPITLVTTDPLHKCCDLFRKMHVRHMIVMDPITG